MANARNFFTEEEKKNIICTIKDAELQTSGEIKVHVENYCKEDVLDKAAAVFASLELHKTARRNGVLFYMAIKDHKYAILGDKGINCCVDECFWDDVKELMAGYFSREQFADGLIEGIKLAGIKLSENFPYQANDVNELPDDISFGN